VITYSAVITCSTDSAKLAAEIFERLVELEECEVRGAADLCRRLATLADLSPTMFLTTIRFGAGDVSAVTQSFADMARTTVRTRQTLHHRWQRELGKVELLFPRLSELMRDERYEMDEAPNDLPHA
jgi:hypothetical protein